jgi:hypothetical protein
MGSEHFHNSKQQNEIDLHAGHCEHTEQHTEYCNMRGMLFIKETV